MDLLSLRSNENVTRVGLAVIKAVLITVIRPITLN